MMNEQVDDIIKRRKCILVVESGMNAWLTRVLCARTLLINLSVKFLEMLGDV